MASDRDNHSRTACQERKDMNLEKAIAIATEAHRGQRDKAGAPYILHPLRVMLALDSPVERMVGVLHDVVEDCPGWTFERLEAEGFAPEVIAALRLVTKAPEDQPDDLESYLGFARRTLANPIARRVKIADIRDNLDVTRMSEVAERDAKRLTKYLVALRLLRDE
jgi:(p)ppGpp synthase/HD superfamily hydrolase